MKCSNIRGESVENINQDGFNPSFQCNPSVGFKCNSKAPCHPCPLINVRLWCGCKKIRSPPSTSGLLPADSLNDYTLTPDGTTISLGREVNLTINSIADGIINGKRLTVSHVI